MSEKMRARIKEAVGTIGRLLSENLEGFDGPDISEALINLGFSHKEIAGAFNFIEKSTLGPYWRKSSRPNQKYVQSKSKKAAKQNSPHPLRMLADIEATKIDAHAHNYLLKLHSVGAINIDTMEEIIDRALGSSEEAIGLSEIRKLTALLLFTRIHSAVSNDALSVSNMLVH